MKSVLQKISKYLIIICIGLVISIYWIKFVPTVQSAEDELTASIQEFDQLKTVYLDSNSSNLLQNGKKLLLQVSQVYKEYLVNTKSILENNTALSSQQKEQLTTLISAKINEFALLNNQITSAKDIAVLSSLSQKIHITENNIKFLISQINGTINCQKANKLIDKTNKLIIFLKEKNNNFSSENTIKIENETKITALSTDLNKSKDYFNKSINSYELITKNSAESSILKNDAEAQFKKGVFSLKQILQNVQDLYLNFY